MTLSVNKQYCFIASSSLFVYFIYALAFPINQGRDFGSYFYYFLDFWNQNPTNQHIMLFRTPGAPFLFGTAHLLGGAFLVEVILGVSYAFMVCIIFKIVATYNTVLALLAVLFIYSNLDFNIIYHSVGVDSLFAVMVVVWFANFFFALKQPGYFKSVLLGISIFLLVMVRPSSQIFVLSGFSLIFLKYPMMKKIKLLTLMLLTYILLASLYATHNNFRYDDFTISRPTKAHTPFYRVFVTDKIIRPDNGIYSKELSGYIDRYLLTQEPYKTYQIDLDTFFKAGDPRMYFDLLPLSDRVYGWDHDYDNLLNVALEGILNFPKEYIMGVLNSLETVFEVPLELRITKFTPATAPAYLQFEKIRDKHYEKILKIGLPIPSELLLIPGGHFPPTSTRPAASSLQKQELEKKLDKITKSYPPRDTNYRVRSALVQLKRISRHLESYKFVLFALLGLVFLKKERVTMIFAFGVIAVSIVTTYASTDTTWQYKIPYDPLFYALGLIGLSGFLSKLKYFRL